MHAENLEDLKDNGFYKVSVLKTILKNLNLNYSIYTIRDYETWKCMDYKCGKRHNLEVSVCDKCNKPVRAPLIKSPRTLGRGRGPGHRRYTAEEIRNIVNIFSERI